MDDEDDDCEKGDHDGGDAGEEGLMAMVTSLMVTAVMMRMLGSAMDSEMGKRQCECACDFVGAYVAHCHVLVTKAVSDFSFTCSSLCRCCHALLVFWLYILSLMSDWLCLFSCFSGSVVGVTVPISVP